MKEVIMATEIAAGTKVHPVIAALENADEPAVVIDGFLGTSVDTVVRLYQALDMSAYVEIPREAVIYLEAQKTGETGAVRAFVRASSEILNVRRYRVRAADLVREFGELPPIQRRPTFWTCAGQCEGVFIDLAIRIHVDEARALNETNPQRQQVLFAQIAQRKHEAKQALLTCLSTCVDTYGVPPFMAVPDASAPGGFRVERFSLLGYHAMLVARHLEKPE
jgi:hypothetical protein